MTHDDPQSSGRDKQAHTAGPWTVRKGYTTAFVQTATEPARHIAEVTEEANARLIALAPMMYNYIQRRADSGDSEAQEVIDAAKGQA